jgi:hypothetical protein
MILLSAFALLGPMAPKMAAPGTPLSRPVLVALVVLQYGAMAALFFAGGIGSIRCRNWARILMLVVSGLWLAFGLMTTLVLAFVMPFVMRTQPTRLSPGQQHGLIVGMISFTAILGVALPAIFLFFYSRKSVKATCLALKGTPVAAPAVASGIPKPSLPVPLAILCVWESIGALAVLACALIPVTFMFGVVLRGAAAVLVLLTYSVLSGSGAWFIYRQDVLGWKIALFKTTLWTFSMIVTYLLHPDMMELFRQIGYDSGPLRIYEQFPQLLPGVWLGSILVITVFLVFLIYTRKFFPPEAPA